MYTGPDYYTIKAMDEFAFDVVRSSDGQRVGTYPSADKAKAVAAGLDKIAMRAYLKQQRKCA